MGEIDSRGSAIETEALNFALIADHLPALVAYVDTREQYLYANATYEKWYQTPLSDLIGRSVRDVLGAERYALVAPYVSRALAGERVTFEMRDTHSDGNTRQVRVQYVPDLKHDKVRGFYALIDDITDLVRGDPQRRLLETAIATSLNAVAVADMDGRLTYINDAFLSLWGYTSRNEVLGRSVTAFWKRPKDAQAVVEAILRHEHWEGVLDALRRDETVATVRMAAHLVRDPSQQPMAIMASVVDVSAQHHAATTLRESESRHREMSMRLNEAQRIAKIGSWELNLAGNSLKWSDEIYRIFEIDPSRFGASYDAFLNAIHPDDRESVNSAYTEALKNRTPYEIVHRLLMPDGRVKWVNERCESFYDVDGKPLRSVGTVQDITEHYQAQLKLRETTWLLDSIVENIPNMIFMKDARDLRFVRFNKAGEDLLGYAREDLLGKSDFDFFPKEQAEFFTAKDRAVLAQHEIVDIPEEPIETKAHGRRILHTKKIALRNDDGVAQYLLGISEDITEQQRARDATFASEKKLRDILDAIFGFVGLYTIDGVLIDANRAPLEAAGLKREDVLGRPFWETYWWNFDVAVQTRLKDALARAARGEIVRYETEVRIKDDDKITIDVTFGPLRDARGHIVNVVGFGVDITERKRAEHALLRSNDLLEERVAERTRELDAERDFIATVLDTAGALVVVLDRDGRIVRFNRACEHLTGYRIDELRERPIWDYLIPSEQVAGVKEVFARLKKTGFPPSMHENEWLTRTGGRRMIAWSNSSIEDATGNVTHVIGTGIDITARKEAERALLNAKFEAERANAAKSEFLSRMSHELRTPLNAILGFAQLLDKYADPPLPANEGESVREILRAGKHLLELINEVLDLSRIEAGHLQVNIDSVALDAAIRDAFTLIHPQADTRRVTLTTDTTPLVVRCDPTRLKQILLNLLSNAVKFNKEGGYVSVRCTRDTLDRARVEVTDSGKGISPESMERLFAPFERLDADMYTIEGTGIGLALTKRLVEAMHGEIGVNSTPGVGTTFWFTLPFEKQND